MIISTVYSYLLFIGPRLFKIFLNDIGFLDLKSMLALFADDTEISFANADLSAY